MANFNLRTAECQLVGSLRERVVHLGVQTIAAVLKAADEWHQQQPKPVSVSIYGLVFLSLINGLENKEVIVILSDRENLAMMGFAEDLAVIKFADTELESGVVQCLKEFHSKT